VRRRALAYATLWGAVALIAVATLVPTRGAVGALPVAWCVTCGPYWLTDAISNVVLFMPLGVALGFLGRRVFGAVLIGAGLSLAVELLQFAGMPAGRTPALSDWITNSTGTLIGAALYALRTTLLGPSIQAARMLLIAWTGVMGAVLVAGNWLLSPSSPSVGATSAVERSTLPFTPGFGWYTAVPDSGFVNEVFIPHGGNGPVIAQMSRTDTIRLSVLVRGRDTRRGTVPIVYVHAPGERRAQVLLGQRGNSAVVRLTLNAARAGLRVPELALHDVFAPSARALETPVQLRATVTGRTLSLVAREGDGTERSTTLSLTPLLGWTLLQSVVRVDSAVAPLLTLLWLLAWGVPWGYWLWRATRREVGLSF